MPNQIDIVYKKLVLDIKGNPILERQLQLTLQKLNHLIQMNFIQKHEDGYCAKFAIPDREINQLFVEFPNITTDEINRSFISSWNVPANAHMHTNVYYHRLLFIVLYGAHNDKDDLAKFALKLVLYRIWNGRLCRLIKYCDPEIMAAAISQFTDNRSLVRKYANPLDLIQNYFAPTLYDKYKSYLIADSVDTKRLFEQCHNRIKQLFGSNDKKDIVTGQTKYQTGLQPGYFKAHETKNRISKIDQSDTNDDRFGSSQAESLIDNVVTFITVQHTKYNPQFIDFVVSNIKGLKSSTVPLILSKIHQMKYTDLIREILELYFRRFRGISDGDMCSNVKFFDLIKIKIISSKNTQDVDYLKRLIDTLLTAIVKNDLEKTYDYMALTDTARAPYRSIIFYGIGYNIQRALCEFK